uniref:NADH-ubiquinone oxidoreductase chain 3 n=1 Tax=Bovicola ovis TaxID=186214 RepID=A0A386B2E2_9NEOP|nr:NADH dehydrogenase subunit 3 [Bovicola ovis]
MLTFFLALMVVILFLLGVFSLFTSVEPKSSSSDSFECGLEMINSNRTPFHIHYFLVGVMFLIFDIEFVVSLPLVFFYAPIGVWLVVWGVYFFILFLGLILEISLGTIDWKVA